MHKRGDFRHLLAWQESIVLEDMVSPLLPKIRRSGSYRLANQIAEAAASIHANIAEGYSKGFGADCARFMRIASGSAAELESRLEGAVRRGIISDLEARPVINQVRRARALIRGFERYALRRANSG